MEPALETVLVRQENTERAVYYYSEVSIGLGKPKVAKKMRGVFSSAKEQSYLARVS